MRNRWGVEVKKGHWVSGRTSRGDMVQGRVAKIERTGDYARAYGPRVILDNGMSLGVDDISQTLGPMTVGRGGVVKQNPAGSTEAVELYWHALNDSAALFDFFDRQGNDPRSVSDWTAFATKAAKSYAREHADASQWADLFPAEVRRETAQLLLRRYIDDINPVNPNPLTRVRIKSPPQRPAGNSEAPSKRLMTRRKKTAKAPAGVYANPVVKPIRNRKAALTHGAPDTMRTWNDHYIVQRSPDPDAKAWDSIGVFPKRVDAENFARNYARQHSTQYVRVVTPD